MAMCDTYSKGIGDFRGPRTTYCIACPYAVLWILEIVRTRLARFSAHAKATQAQDISFPLKQQIS